MAKRNGNSAKDRNGGANGGQDFSAHRLHPDTKKSIWGVGFICVAVVLTLAGFGWAGPAGALAYKWLDALFGWGYFILPLTLVFAAIVLLASGRKKIVGTTLIGAALLIFSFLGLIEIFYPEKAGLLGLVLGSLHYPFGMAAAAIINGFILIISVLVTANVPIKIKVAGKNNRGGRGRAACCDGNG